MAMKHISDVEVLRAYEIADWNSKNRSIMWPEAILKERTGQPEKVCYRAMERACDRGLLDYGVSLRSGWLTDKGKALLEAEYQRTMGCLKIVAADAAALPITMLEK